MNRTRSRDHSLAVTADGHVWAWGRNAAGQLGDGTAINRAVPVEVTGLVGATAVAGGADFSLALVTDGAREGTLWSWGANTMGQLGDGTTFPRAVPVRVVGLPAATAVRAGSAYASVLASDGRVWAWGANDYGQLGDGTTQSQLVPHPVAGLARMAAIGAGVWHALAVGDDGAAWAWGYDDLGQTGSGLVEGSGTPAVVPGRMANAGVVLQSAGGMAHSILLGADGRVRATGDNVAGQLGTGTTTDSVAPVPVPDLVLVQNDSVLEDPDGDGTASWRELVSGTDPLVADSNGDGVPDGVEVENGGAAADPDVDGDGVPSAIEMAQGTDPFIADTDGDGVNDGLDAFPLDPTRSVMPVGDPDDHTPPTITLTLPASARRIGGLP